jgi:hypothetical protein
MYQTPEIFELGRAEKLTLSLWSGRNLLERDGRRERWSAADHPG